MPFVGSDAHPARKRRWQDEETDPKVYRLYSPDESKSGDFLLLNPDQDNRPRKVLPLSKRARITDDELYLHDDRRKYSPPPRIQDQPKVVRPSLEPCHICHRKPTKKSHLDSFAECQGCGERTCFVCIRQCQRWGLEESSVPNEQEILSRSFHMDDVDDMQERRKQGGTNGWNAQGHQSMVCSRCCVERGAEGDVVCLGCLSGMEGA